MKKAVIVAWILAGILLLSGCGACKHEFTRATCTSPQVCSKCGEFSGLALGHDFAPADCSHPKYCIRCGIEYGEPLGHVPGNPANYQDPCLCEICGEIVEEKLPPEYEALGYLCSVTVGEPADYTVYCENNPALLSTGKLTVTSCERITDFADVPDAAEGYEWIALEADIVFDDQNAEGGIVYPLTENYYETEHFREFAGIPSETSEVHFPVSFHGMDYLECISLCSVTSVPADNGAKAFHVSEKVLVPLGYDGAVAAFICRDCPMNELTAEELQMARFFRLA